MNISIKKYTFLSIGKILINLNKILHLILYVMSEMIKVTMLILTNAMNTKSKNSSL